MMLRGITLHLVLATLLLFLVSPASAQEKGKAELGYEAWLVYLGSGEASTPYLPSPTLAEGNLAWYVALTPRASLSRDVKLRGKVPYAGYITNALGGGDDSESDAGLGDSELGLDWNRRWGRLSVTRVFGSSKNSVGGAALDGWRYDTMLKKDLSPSKTLALQAGWFLGDGEARNSFSIGPALLVTRRDDEGVPTRLAVYTLRRTTFGEGDAGLNIGESDGWQLVGVWGPANMRNHLFLSISDTEASDIAFALGVGWAK